MKRFVCMLIPNVLGTIVIFAGFALNAHAQHVGIGAMAFAQVFGRARGGNLAPCREIYDPYPEFNGIGLDPAHNLAAMSDTNLKSLLVYSMNAGGADDAALTPHLQQIKGPDTYISYAAGVAFDPVRHELCVTENDIGDDVACFPYGANGNSQAQVLAVPHGAYGLAFSQRLKQMAVAVEHNEQIIFYRTGATGAQLPLRAIRGPHTGMADPHGLYWDEINHEIATVNHGNWSQAYWDLDYPGGGHYQPPSITIFAEDAKGDAAPLRTIQGARTQLDWPTGIAVDTRHNEIAVANTAGGSILIFSRTARGNVAPVRVIKGPRTGVTIPMGVAFDPMHDQLWVANFGHTALVFDRLAQGDTPPLRVIRNAPAGTPMAGFGNPFTIAYDSKRDELIVPN
ncbi:MAG TPA: hypothetical protein VKV28_02665 [Candidatus Binataceae bacterium]|nr:hypothetical protein [Candidatus Binataceae bacterium]